VSLKKILVIDDSELLHRMYDLVLRRYRDMGAEILHARNGSEGLVTIRTHPGIDLVLLDVNMPVMNGLQLLTGLKAGRLLSGLTVIMVSSEGSEYDVQIAMEKGAVGYVTKPFQPNDLHVMIDRHFPYSPIPQRVTA
jgi:two-component system chemotaxis response regulator CheY